MVYFEFNHDQMEEIRKRMDALVEKLKKECFEDLAIDLRKKSRNEYEDSETDRVSEMVNEIFDEGNEESI